MQVSPTPFSREGGEQGDPLMPMLYNLGQHRALEAIHSSFQPTETLMAFLDDVYAVTPSPDRVGGIYGSIQENMWVHSSIRIDGGKTQVWNAAGRKPAVCEVLDRVAQAADPAAKVWKGSEVPPNQRGLKILGAPFGHPEFVAAQLEKSFQKQETLIRRIPLVPDLQAAWLILLHCASARANYLLRVVDPEQVQQFAQMHNQRLWQCLCQLLGLAPDLCDDAARSFSWRTGFEKCIQDQDGRVLGELGRWFAHDQRSSSWSGCPNHYSIGRRSKRSWSAPEEGPDWWS